mgnify:FL=1
MVVVVNNKLQFIYYIIKSVFSTGANISKEKDKNNDAVMSGLFIGTIVSFIIFNIILLNIDNFIWVLWFKF